eukprot:SAG31_NODE_8926_length_1362_cov_1.548694_2_plen_372_part_00
MQLFLKHQGNGDAAAHGGGLFKLDSDCAEPPSSPTQDDAAADAAGGWVLLADECHARGVGRAMAGANERRGPEPNVRADDDGWAVLDCGPPGHDFEQVDDGLGERCYFLVFVQLFEKYGTLIERYTALIEKVPPCIAFRNLLPREGEQPLQEGLQGEYPKPPCVASPRTPDSAPPVRLEPADAAGSEVHDAAALVFGDDPEPRFYAAPRVNFDFVRSVQRLFIELGFRSLTPMQVTAAERSALYLSADNGAIDATCEEVKKQRGGSPQLPVSLASASTRFRSARRALMRLRRWPGLKRYASGGLRWSRQCRCCRVYAPAPALGRALVSLSCSAKLSFLVLSSCSTSCRCVQDDRGGEPALSGLVVPAYEKY